MVYLVDQIDPRDCREHVKRNFDKHQMVRNYIATYEKVLNLSAAIAKSHYVLRLPSHVIERDVTEEVRMDSSAPLAQNAPRGILESDRTGLDTVIRHLDKLGRDIKTEQEGLPPIKTNKN